MKNVIISGFGMHTMHYHFPIIRKINKSFQIQIVALIDLESMREDIEEFLIQNDYSVQNKIYLKEEERNSSSFSDEAKESLAQILESHKIDLLVIATEPKAHKKFIEWGLENNIDIILDKPVTANVIDKRDINTCSKLYDDFKKIIALNKQSIASLRLLTHRRYNITYTTLLEKIGKLVAEIGVPITHINMYIAEGVWNMPNEFLSRENHPYKYGYGMLLHTGYHFIDMLFNIINVNRQIDSYELNNVSLVSQSISPSDFMSQMTDKMYQKLFQNDQINFSRVKNNKNLDLFGELDVHTIFKFFNNDSCLVTANLSLIQTAVAKRGWLALPKNTYRSNGRTKQELINIQFGNLAHVKVEYASPFEGDKDFKITIYRNIEILEGLEKETILISGKNDYIIGEETYNVANGFSARANVFLEWLNGSKNTSALDSHKNGILALSKMYESLSLDYQEKNPKVSFPIEWR